VSAFVPVAKHDPALKKPKPVTLSGPLLVTVKVVTKFSRLACSVPPVSCASQFPVAWVFVVFDGAPLVPHPQTASSSASRTTRASFFMNRPSNGVSTRIERCGQGRQWMYGRATPYELRVGYLAPASRPGLQLHRSLL